MKTIRVQIGSSKVAKRLVAALTAFAMSWAAGAMAADAAIGDAVQKVTVERGVLIATIDGKPSEATNEITFPKDVVIGTNAIFKVAGGRERKLGEGQILSRDGMLTSPDGSIVPVEDHIVAKGGRVYLVKDGESQPLGDVFVLKNGTKVEPSGKMTTTRNLVKHLLDGQLIRLNDTTVEATDTALLEKGKVTLYKDGSRIELRPGQTMAMSDGSRVNAGGYVIRQDGSRVNLTEGELFKFAGAGDGR